MVGILSFPKAFFLSFPTVKRTDGINYTNFLWYYRSHLYLNGSLPQKKQRIPIFQKGWLVAITMGFFSSGMESRAGNLNFIPLQKMQFGLRSDFNSNH